MSVRHPRQIIKIKVIYKKAKYYWKFELIFKASPNFDEESRTDQCENVESNRRAGESVVSAEVCGLLPSTSLVNRAADPFRRWLLPVSEQSTAFELLLNGLRLFEGIERKKEMETRQEEILKI